MKIIILSLRHTLCIALFVALNSLLYSQGNLQFNQVISASATLGLNGASAVVTVPVDKVWKIESVNGWADCGSRLGITINTIPTLVSNAKFPIWLKSGDLLRMTVQINAASGVACGPMNYYYSIIEFNIIP
jgi:hypothetical protein